MSKVCTKCKKELLATKEYFYIEKRTKDGLWSQCKKCWRKHLKKYSQKHQQQRSNVNKKYRNTVNGYLREVFAHIKYRCGNPAYKDYKWYGARGIKNKFKSFDDFKYYVVNVLKIDPRKLTIDRINNNGHYEPRNIRFVTQAENNRNKKGKHLICLNKI